MAIGARTASLSLARACGLDIERSSTTFYLGRETLLTDGQTKMAAWRKPLVAYMSRNARSDTALFGIPPGRVVEQGSQVELQFSADPPPPGGFQTPPGRI